MFSFLYKLFTIEIPLSHHYLPSLLYFQHLLCLSSRTKYVINENYESFSPQEIGSAYFCVTNLKGMGAKNKNEYEYVILISILMFNYNTRAMSSVNVNVIDFDNLWDIDINYDIKFQNNNKRVFASFQLSLKWNNSN